MAACKTTSVVTLSRANPLAIAEQFLPTSQRHLGVAIVPKTGGKNMRCATGYAPDQVVSQILWANSFQLAAHVSVTIFTSTEGVILCM